MGVICRERERELFVTNKKYSLTIPIDIKEFGTRLTPAGSASDFLGQNPGLLTVEWLVLPDGHEAIAALSNKVRSQLLGA